MRNKKEQNSLRKTVNDLSDKEKQEVLQKDVARNMLSTNKFTICKKDGVIFIGPEKS